MARKDNIVKPIFDLPPEMKQHLDLAYSCKKDRAFASALRECTIALKTDPFCAEAHNLRGMILEELGRNVEAMNAYDIAARLDPDFVQAAQNLARIKVNNRLEVQLPMSFKLGWGGMILFALCMSVPFLGMSQIMWPGVFWGVAVAGFLCVYVWWMIGRLPRVIDEEGITKRNGRRVLWKDLTKVVRVTNKFHGARISGSLKLHFRGEEDEEVVDIAPYLIPADKVVAYVARKAGAYPG